MQEVLSEELESVQADDDVNKAADLMASRQIRRLPVLDDGKLVGIVSLGDIAVKHEEDTAAQALEGVSEGVKAAGRTAALASEGKRPKRTATKSGRSTTARSRSRRSQKKAA